MSWGPAPVNWYWDVLDTNHGTQVWQGATGQFVVLANADYVAFLAAGNLPTVIDTFVNLCQAIDAYNNTVNTPGYLAVTSGVNYQMANTPPRFFQFNATTTGLSLTLPQMNVPGSLAMGRPLLIQVNTAAVTLKSFSGSTLLTVPANSTIEVLLTANNSQGGALDEINFFSNSRTTHGDVGTTLAASGALITVHATNAALTAARQWSLPNASSLVPGTFFLVSDDFGGVTATNTLTVVKIGLDTINLGAAGVVINRAFDHVFFECDGVSNWAIVGGKGALASTDLTDLPVAWTSYTATLTPNAGSITQGGSASFLQLGKIVMYSIAATVTNLSGGPANFKIDLPVAPKRDTAIQGAEDVNSVHTLILGTVVPAGATRSFIVVDAAQNVKAPVLNDQYNFAGVYEAQ